MAATLKVSLSHAISYLTRPLIVSYKATTIIKLQLVLEANLTALFAPSWSPNDPLRGSGRRCLTLSPKCLPPRAIYSACLAANVQWFDWIALLGGREFDFFVDPACVSVRFGKNGNPNSPLITVWSEQSAIPPSLDLSFEQDKLDAQFTIRSKTLAQQLLEEDRQEDDELFAMLADEISAPTWMTPVLDQFPVSARPSSPLSAVSTHSRSSSRSSNSSSGFSFGSANSHGSATTVSTHASSPRHERPKQSRRERS
jgi:hypothetical protein